MSGKRRKALNRKGLSGNAARRELHKKPEHGGPKRFAAGAKPNKPSQVWEPTPGSKKALLQQKRLLGKQTPSPEAVEAKKLFFFQRLVDEAKRQALAQVGARKRREVSGHPGAPPRQGGDNRKERKNRVVFR